MVMSYSQNTNSYIKSAEENAVLQMEFENDQKEEASEAVLFLLKEQANIVIQLPDLSNRDMLTTSLVANRDLPRKVKQKVSMLGMNLQHIIWEVAIRVESQRYEPVTQGVWSEPLRVDNELSNANSWREVHEENEAALRPGIQDISNSRT